MMLRLSRSGPLDDDPQHIVAECLVVFTANLMLSDVSRRLRCLLIVSR